MDRRYQRPAARCLFPYGSAALLLVTSSTHRSRDCTPIYPTLCRPSETTASGSATRNVVMRLRTRSEPDGGFHCNVIGDLYAVTCSDSGPIEPSEGRSHRPAWQSSGPVRRP
jgi:hypothetical protein